MSQQSQSTPPPPQSGVPPYSGAPMQTAYSTQTMVADKAAQLSLIFGVIGLFVAGIVFGPLAIWQASKAEKMNKSATPGKVLGWIDLVVGIGQIVLFFVVIASFMAAGSSY